MWLDVYLIFPQRQSPSRENLISIWVQERGIGIASKRDDEAKREADCARAAPLVRVGAVGMPWP